MRNRVIKNSALLLLGQTLGRLFGFLTVPLLARGLGPNAFGAFSVALAVTSLAGILGGFGLDQFATREIARFPEQKRGIFIGGMVAKTMGGLAVIIIIAIMNYGFNLFGLTHDAQTAMTFLSICIIFNALISLSSSYYYGQQKMAVGSALGLILYLANFIFVYLIFVFRPSLITFALALALSSAAATLTLIPLMVWNRHGSEVRPFISLKRLKRLVLDASPFMFMGLSLVVYYRIDIFCLSYLASHEAVGFFAAASRVLETLMFLPAAFMGALFPAVSGLAATAKEDIPRIMEKSLRCLALVGLPAAAGISILAPQIVDLLFGPNWGETARNLQILIWAWGVIFISAIGPVALNALGYTKLNIITIIVGVFFKLILNIVLIPRYGAVMVCWTTLLTEIVSAVLYLTFAYKVVGRFKIAQNITQPLVATLIMFIALIGIKRLVEGFYIIPVVIVSGIIIYSFYLLITRAVTLKELSEIIMIFKWKLS